MPRTSARFVASARRFCFQRPLRAVLPLVAIAATPALPVTPAIAADQQVRVADTAFAPAAVAVRPGDTVTWNYLGDSEEHHSVHFEDEGLLFENTNPAVPWTTERTFTESKAYRYYCDHHGGPGGQGMAGIVYVNEDASLPGTEPTATLSASTDGATVGQTVTFSAAGSADPDPGGAIIRYEFDLDGNGTFETDRGEQTTASWEYTTPGPRTVRVRVTDSDLRTKVATRAVTVTDVAPPPPPPPPPVAPPPPPAVVPSPLAVVPPPTPPASSAAASVAPTLGKVASRLRLSRAGRVSIRLACRTLGQGVAPTRCRGTLTLSMRIGRRTVTVGRASFNFPRTATKSVSIRLSAAGRRALRKTTAATLRVRVPNSGSATRTATKRVRLAPATRR